MKIIHDAHNCNNWNCAPEFYINDEGDLFIRKDFEYLQAILKDIAYCPYCGVCVA